MAIAATVFVEEPFLELRKKVIPMIFKKPVKVESPKRMVSQVVTNK
jgi:hypothetical protein